jgi:hypothetical protein
MKLSYRFSDDWFIYAQATDGSWWSANTETWPEWLDAAKQAGADRRVFDAVTRLAGDEDATERHIVARVTAWDTELSPTATPVSRPTREGLQGVIRQHPLGFTGFASWERVPGDYTDDLTKTAAAVPLRADGTVIPCEWPKGCDLRSRESVLDTTHGELALCRQHAKELRNANHLLAKDYIPAPHRLADLGTLIPDSAMEHHVEYVHAWPEGWREARCYLPLECPNCRRLRLLYALRIDGSEGILVHCEKCGLSSHPETEPDDPWENQSS